MSRFSRLVPIIGGAIAGGVIALVVASGSGGTHTVTTTIAQPATSPAVPTAVSTSRGMSINQIYRNASPGVVDITVTEHPERRWPGFFGGGGGARSSRQTGEGAGVVYDTKGNILTDEHVVANATTSRSTSRTAAPLSAKVVGTDPSTDVAVIHVDVPASELHPIPFADSSSAQVGDPVVAIGSPFSLPRRPHRASSAPSGAASPRRTTSRSPARSRPTRRSTRVTPAARCWTPTATSSASTTRSRPTLGRTPASGSRSRPARSRRSRTTSSPATP